MISISHYVFPSRHVIGLTDELKTDLSSMVQANQVGHHSPVETLYETLLTLYELCFVLKNKAEKKKRKKKMKKKNVDKLMGESV